MDGARRSNGRLPSPSVARGLNSDEIRKSEEIPFVDEIINIEDDGTDEPTRPGRQKQGKESNVINEIRSQIHATDIGDVHSTPDSDTIVVSTPEGTLYITLKDTEGVHKSKSSPANTPPATDDDIIAGTSNAEAALDSVVLIEHERGEPEKEKKSLLRRNSISMPILQNVGLDEIQKDCSNSAEDEVRLFFSYILIHIILKIP